MNIQKIIKRLKPLFIDFLIIIFVIFLSFLLVFTNIEETILSNFENHKWVAYLLGGVFSVNFITAFPAYAFLTKVVTPDNFYLILFCLAIGSLIGDLLIFNFVKFRLIESLLHLFDHNPFVLKIVRNKNKWIRGILLLTGFFIIASPFPDELAVLLIGFAHLKNKYFIPISFLLNLGGNYILLSLFLG